MSPATTRRIALVLSALIFLVVHPLLNAFARDRLPHFIRSNGSDFSQYYSAALAVKEGLPDNLYPQPDPRIYSKPPSFRPFFITPFFDPDADDSRSGKWAYYPQVARPEASRVSERLNQRCPRLQDSWRFVSPPPLALVLSPLALFEFETACRLIWFPLMCASLFGISWFSAKICRHLYGRESHVEALAALLPVIPALLGSSQATNLSIGNASPLLGFLITLAGHAFLTNKQVLLGLCIIPLVLFKGIGISWCPLLLIGGIKWRTLGVMAALTLLLNALTLYFGGTCVYETFFSEILPKAHIPVGTGISGILMTLLGIDAGSLMSLIHMGCLVSIYLLHDKGLRRGNDSGLLSISAVIASIALFYLLNPVVWPNYLSLYLFLPFSAWIIHEVSMRRGGYRIPMLLLLSSIVLCWMDSLFVIRTSLLVEFLEHRNLYPAQLDILRKFLSALALYAIPNAICLTVLALAAKRLLSCAFASRSLTSDL